MSVSSFVVEMSIVVCREAAIALLGSRLAVDKYLPGVELGKKKGRGREKGRVTPSNGKEEN